MGLHQALHKRFARGEVLLKPSASSSTWLFLNPHREKRLRSSERSRYQDRGFSSLHNSRFPKTSLRGTRDIKKAACFFKETQQPE